MQPIEAKDLALDGEWLTRLARVLVRDPQGAQDLAQGVWLAFFRTPRVPRHRRAWLSVAARNLARKEGISERARRGRQERVSRGDAQPDTTAELARAELHALVAHEVLALDEIYREVLVLRYFEGLSTRAVASRLGIKASTVRTRTERALEHLRLRLDRRGDGDRQVWLQALAPFSMAGRGASMALAVGLVGGLLTLGTWAWSRPPASAAPVALEETASLEEVGAMSGLTETGPREVVQARDSSPSPETSQPAPAAPAVDEGGHLPSGTVEILVRRDDGSAPGTGRAYFAEQPQGWSVRPDLDLESGDTRSQDLVEGRASFVQVRPGKWVGAVVVDGIRVQRAIEVQAGQGTRAVFEFGSARLHGRVYDSHGQPLAGARIHMTYRSGGDERVVTRSDDTGRYSLDGLRSLGCWGSFHAASSPPEPPDLRFEVALEPGEIRRHDFGRPEGSARWTGHLRTQQGAAPVEVTVLRLRREELKLWLPCRVEAGVISIDLEPGSWTVSLSEGPTNRTELARFEVGTRDFTHDLTLPGARVHGRLLDLPDDAGSHRPYVSLYKNSVPRSAPRWKAQWIGDRYVIDGVAPGTWYLRVQGLPAYETTLEVVIGEGDAERVLDLSRSR